MSSVEEIHDWLNALGLLPEHDEDAVLGDLLKDGISLCRLVNRLKPGTVTNISTGYQPENALHNTEKFLQACKVLGIKESFNPSDLLEMRDFDKVLATLQGLFQYSSQIGLGKSFTRHRKGSSASPPPMSFTAPAADGQAQHVVKALYNFKGTGDDELSFQKGDLIMVIKVVDGGWWEGIIEDRVGWFPGNHVEEVAPEENSFKESKKLAINKRDSVLRYHDLVVQDIIDSERTYVLEMMTLLSAYLTPLKTADVLTPDEVSHLTGNLPALAAAHEKFFKRLEELVKLPAEDQTIAKLFMDVSSEMEQLYTAYCMNHPRAVAILTDNSDKLSAYMESKGASIPGMLVLTQNLSKPIRRLEKYPALLVELQRHTQDSHKDKCNVQKAIEFYGALLTSTQEARKKKDAEYEMLSNPVKGYAGKSLMELGECSCVVTGSEVISAQVIDERFYLVFPGVLVILAVGQSLSGYELQYKFSLDTITIKKTQDEENFINAIEITYSGNKCIQTSISSLKDMNLLLETIAAKGKAVDMSKVTLTTSSPPRVTSGHHYATHRRVSSNPVQRQRFWGFKSLRPAPPLNSTQILQLREQEKEKDTKSSVKSHKAAFINVATSFKRRSKVEEVHPTVTTNIERVAPDSLQATSGGDTAVLRVIEAYCLGSKMKQAAMLDQPVAAATIIPIRQVPSAPASYTLPRHASTSQLEQKQLSSPKNKRRFSFMPSRKEPSQSLLRSPLRRSLREMSLRKKQQSGSLPDFSSFNMGKNKNSNCNQSKITDTKSTFGGGVVTRIPPPNQHELSGLNSNNSNNNDVIPSDDDENNTEEDGDLVHTTSEISFTSSVTEEVTPKVRNRSSSDSVNLKLKVPQISQGKPALRDSDENLDQKQLPSLIAKGLCFGSYAFYKK